CSLYSLFFFFKHPAPTDIYTRSLHDALPIWQLQAPTALPWGPFGAATAVTGTALALIVVGGIALACGPREVSGRFGHAWLHACRSEEHTSELQSRGHLVCRLLLEKKKKTKTVVFPKKLTRTNAEIQMT